MTSTVLITGASSGIGRELARLFARDGYTLILVARRIDALEQLGRELAAQHGIKYWVIGADLADPAAPASIVDRIPESARPVSALVNNAGFGLWGSFAETDRTTEVELLQVNVIALTELTKRLLPSMLERRHGRILNVASTAAFQPGPFMAVYYASKAYVLSFSEAITEELRGTGVTVTTLCPGPVRTEFLARAGLSGVSWAEHNPLMLDASTVARAGYRGLRRGARLVLPGLSNKLLALFARLTHNRLVVRVTRLILERRDGAPRRGKAG